MSHSIAETRKQRPMWVYEKNYTSLVRLLPFLVNREQDCLHLRQKNWILKASVLEHAPYTQVVELKQSFSTSNKLLKDIYMKVRVYHDACLVEVIAYQGLGRILPQYTYPNEKMLHKDEKRQANVLLHDWLIAFFRKGLEETDYRLCPES